MVKMEIDIIWLASALTALCTILGMAWKLHIFLNKMESKFDKYDETINQNTIHILRMALLSEDVPLLDRINAGRKYIELGGNGYGHVVYEKLLKELDENPPIVK